MGSTAPLDSSPGAAVSAEGLGVRGPRGWAFRDVTLSAAPGSLIAVEGPSGSGRTCLLLALTGRMRVHTGHAEVAGHRLPRRMSAVRRVSALAHVPGVTELDPAFTVAEQLRERALLERRFGGSPLALLRPRRERAAASRARIDAALASAGLDTGTLPKGPRTAVRDLDRVEALRLSLALGLIGRPALLAVDDVDLKLSDAEREQVWDLLRTIAAEGVTVLAVCGQAPEGAVTVSTAPATRRAAAPDDGAGSDDGPRTEDGSGAKDGPAPGDDSGRADDPGTADGSGARDGTGAGDGAAPADGSGAEESTAPEDRPEAGGGAAPETGTTGAVDGRGGTDAQDTSSTPDAPATPARNSRSAASATSDTPDEEGDGDACSEAGRA